MEATSDTPLDPVLRAAATTTPAEVEELGRVAAALFGASTQPQFGRYRTVRAIGAGGLGAVHLAHDPELDRLVAIKTIARRLDAVAREQLQARMRREAQALARLRHPNVVGVYDVGVAGEEVFLAMEYVEGGTLGEWLRERPRASDEIVAVVIEAGRGLAAAHAAGVFHRDVKPSNVLVDREGRARVVDFGLAFADADPRAEGEPRRPIELTQTGAMLGTPAYMAPEQFASGTIDARTDQWGLAVTLHEALAGARPFAGDDLASLRLAIAEHAYVPPTDASPHVKAALVRALQRDPAARFPDMHAFVAALEHRVRRSRTKWLGVAAIAVLGMGGAAWASRSMVEPAAAVRVADLRALWSTPNAVRWAWTSEGSADELRDYELVVGPTEADVRAKSERTRVFGRAENPELGHFLLPRTGGAEPVQATITDGHAPDEAVFAMLVAIDTAGHRHESNVASIHTAPPPVAEIVVFADERPSGAPLPEDIELSTARPFAGTHHLQFTSHCVAPECFANLRWQGLDVALDRLTPGDWKTTTYLELAVAVDGDATSWWSQLRIWCDESSLDHVGHFNSFALRKGGEYRVLQVPLRAFVFSPELDPAVQIEHGLHEVGVGGWWPPGATVRIDEIRVRW